METLSAAADLFGLVAEPTRVRLLRLLARHELSVAELVTVTDLPQSSVSTHLGKLRDAGMVRDRKNGTSTYYALAETMPAGARQVWDIIADHVGDKVLASDEARAEGVLKARLGAFPESMAGEMERHYSPGRTWESLAFGLLGLLRLGRVLDVGCGDGAVAAMLAPRARSITCIDASERMVAAAQRRLEPFEANVVQADMHEVPFDDESFDQVLLLNVLVHPDKPARAVDEAARVLAPGGDLVIVTLDAHAHADVAQSWGHHQQGISPVALRRMLKHGSLSVSRCEVVTRERRAPHFGVVACYATKPAKKVKS